MKNIKIAHILYESLTNTIYKLTEQQKVNIITNLFKISVSTFYRWQSSFNENFTFNDDNNCFTNIIYTYNSTNITKPIVNYIVLFIKNNINVNVKKIKKNIDIFFPNNKISYKQINHIIYINKLNIDSHKHSNHKYKINDSINDFIIETIKNNNCLTAKDIVLNIYEKYKVNVSLTTIYNILKKNNYVYKKTITNINPYSFDDQYNHLYNVYQHLNNNNMNNVNCLLNDKYIERVKNEIHKMNEILKNDNTNNLIKSSDELNKLINQTSLLINDDELFSVDEMSIITNKTPIYGWSLKNEEAVINIPYLKPNKRYSLLMAVSNKKNIKYKLVEGSIKTDDFIAFIKELNDINPNCKFLIDNASIHKNKKTKQFYKNNNVHIIFNAPYQSKFNPIEMIFSLLRKKLNKSIVKSSDEINKIINLFTKEIKQETLINIFNHSTNELKKYLKL